ncbi:MAG: DNA mismatch repair endonuclease MutH [Gammaproteobacteria bacterium]|nr:MAG: DNA mismatch repair endonuclease MutH [Gammaproteobacteria bacterium]
MPDIAAPLVSPPNTVEELLSRANDLAGHRLGELARQADIHVPADLKRHKGWTGQALERLLGATASNLAEPDFQQLGIELKTIPVDHKGQPMESTFVCSLSLNNVQLDWQASPVYRKLRQVLWIPVQGDRRIELKQRCVGAPLLWSPSVEQHQCLQQDWVEIMEMISQGKVESVDARQGNCLQLRPKAANGSEKCSAINEEGQRFQTLPRGFYLRRRFTCKVLAGAYLLPGR